MSMNLQGDILPGSTSSSFFRVAKVCSTTNFAPRTRTLAITFEFGGSTWLATGVELFVSSTHGLCVVEVYEIVHQLTALRDRLGVRPEAAELFGGSLRSGTPRLRVDIVVSGSESRSHKKVTSRRSVNYQGIGPN